MRELWVKVIVAAPLIIAPMGCGGGTRVMVPPRIDLREHEVLAIIEFKSSREGELGPLATARFVEAIRADQGLVRIIDLGPESEALRAVGAGRLDRTAYQALGQEHEVNTIFTGELIISDIRPAIQITSDLANMGVAADVDATLNVKMIETTSGASIWSRSADVTKRVGQVSMLGSRDVVFDAENPERAYGELIDALVVAVSGDFRATWERR